MVYTALAPVKVLVRKATSSTEPAAAIAPSAVRSFRFSALRPITVTWWPAFNNSSVSGFEMFPAPPVITYFIICYLGYLYIQLLDQKKSEIDPVCCFA